MKKLKYIPHFILLLLAGCSALVQSRKDIKEANVQVIQIDEFGTMFRIKGFDQSQKDTIYVISWKKERYDKLGIKPPKRKNGTAIPIVMQSSYAFELTKMKIIVSTMEQLGQFIIVENDTLWQGPSRIQPPKYYTAQNTIGLTCLQ